MLAMRGLLFTPETNLTAMRILTLCLTLALSHFFILSAKEQNITSKVTAAKVFLSGAQVTRSATAPISVGSSTLIFTGLSQQLDPQSIQVNGKGGFSILSVNQRINYLTESPKKAEMEDLEKKIKKLQHDIGAQNNALAVLQNEEQLLNKNSAIGGQQQGVTLQQLQGINDYVRQRLSALRNEAQSVGEKTNDLNQELGKLQQQMQTLQAEAPQPTGEIVVEIDAPVEVTASFTLTYFVGSAGWTPAYDLRAKNTSSPIELLMKAQVVNNTGEDWEKVDLALSSGNPTLGGVMPTLAQWILDQPIYRTEGYFKKMRGDGNMPAAAPSVAKDDEATREQYEEMPAQTEVGNTVIALTTTVEFSIDAPFSVPSDGVAHMVGVKSSSVPAIYKHYCTPKLDRDAFLYARTTGWEDLNLIPGEANVFFEGTFVGHSYLDLSHPEDTLDISLGRDKGVTVERVKKKGFNDKGFVNGKRTVTIGWDINVRNTKSTAIDLEVRDQHPTSSRSEIEVKLIDSGGAEVEEATGKLTWAMHLEPKASKKLSFSYSVKHPKEMPVVLE